MAAPRPGKPLMWRRPPIASATDANPARPAYGPRLAVAGDARQDEAGIDLREPLVPEAPALERARPEVLGQHVGYTHQLEQQLLAARRAQIERDALLVPRLDRPHQGSPLVARLAPLAQRIRLPRRLHLDHLRAHVAQETAGERPASSVPSSITRSPASGPGPAVSRAGSELTSLPPRGAGRARRMRGRAGR